MGNNLKTHEPSATPIKIFFSLLKAGKLKAERKTTKDKLKAHEMQAKSKLKECQSNAKGKRQAS